MNTLRLTDRLARMLLPCAAALLLCTAPRAQEAAGAAAPGLNAWAAKPGSAVIARAWHGKTPRDKADEYERYLADAIKKFPSIKGNLGYQMMRLDGGPDGAGYVEFQVISYWENLESIKAYAGENVDRTRDLPRDKEYLVDMEPHVRNYRLMVNMLRP